MNRISVKGILVISLLVILGICVGAVGSVSAQDTSTAVEIESQLPALSAADHSSDTALSSELTGTTSDSDGPVAEITVTDDSIPASVQPGDSFDVTFVVTNTGDEDANTGGIEFATPSEITADDVFFFNGIGADESTTETVTFELDESADSGERTITADASVGDSTDSATFSVMVDQPAATADIEVVSGPEPDPVTPGDSFDMVFSVTNTGDVDADSGGIQFTTPNGIVADDVFFTGGVDSDQQINTTVTFNVNDAVENNEYTVTADAQVGDDADSAEIPITVSDDEGLSRFDQDNTGSIEFSEVIAAIEARNTGGTIGGQPVGFEDVIAVIEARNTGAEV